MQLIVQLYHEAMHTWVCPQDRYLPSISWWLLLCLFNTFTRCKLDNRQTYANNVVNSFHSNVLYFQRLQKWRLGWNGLNCFSTSIIIITIYLIGRNEQNFYEHLPWRTYTDNCWSNDMWQSIIRKNKSGDLPLNQIWFKCKKDQLEKDTILAGPK